MRILALATSIVLASAGVAPAQRVPADSLYLRGRQLLSDNDYRRAATLFKEAHDRDPRGSRAGEALYYRAWALYQADPERNTKSLLDGAADALDEQAKSYASTVTQDSKDLLVRVRAAQARLGNANAAADISKNARALQGSRGCPRDEDDMRLAALQGLM